MMPLQSKGSFLAQCTRLRQLRRKGEQGVGLVEYAFILIIFLTLILGISGFGQMLYVYHAVNNAAKEGTRWAAVNGATCGDDSSCNGTNGMNSGPASLAQIQTHVTAQLPASLDQSIVAVTANWSAPSAPPGTPAMSPPICTTAVGGTPATPNAQGCTVSVQVSYPYNFYFPFIPTTTATTAPCTSAGFCLSSTSEMVIVH
jgi:Flp pilus assembly protein TadG